MHALKVFFCVGLAGSLAGCVDYMIDRAANGTHCVAPDTKVGDLIKDNETGGKLRVVKLSSTEDGKPFEGCSARFPVRAKVEKPGPS